MTAKKPAKKCAFFQGWRLAYTSVEDPGEGPGGPAPPYFSPKMRPEGPKKYLGDTPPPLSQALDDPPPPSPLSEGLNPPLYLYQVVRDAKSHARLKELSLAGYIVVQRFSFVFSLVSASNVTTQNNSWYATIWPEKTDDMENERRNPRPQVPYRGFLAQKYSLLA